MQIWTLSLYMSVNIRFCDSNPNQGTCNLYSAARDLLYRGNKISSHVSSQTLRSIHPWNVAAETDQMGRLLPVPWRWHAITLGSVPHTCTRSLNRCQDILDRLEVCILGDWGGDGAAVPLSRVRLLRNISKLERRRTTWFKINNCQWLNTYFLHAALQI